MKEYLYVVIILNYNSYSDSILAAKSVIGYARTEDYLICIADNASTNKYEMKNLQSVDLKNTIIFSNKNNFGYAKGNNEAIRHIKSLYKFKYIVIMNPDVTLIENSIDEMIEQIEKENNSKIVGGQPLVWNYRYSNNAKNQINIGRVPTYFDMYISSLCLFRILFKKRWKKTNYINEMPYANKIKYHVPSGAFFIIDVKVFSSIDLFDEDTFLFGEERIIGYKLKKMGYQMLFMPQYKVKHVHGKSTNSSRFNVKKSTLQFSIQSRKVYLNKYVKVGTIMTYAIIINAYIDYYIRKIFALYYRLKLLRSS